MYVSGNGKELKITPIKEVDPMLDDIAVQGRCISIFHSHKLNAKHDPYNLDLMLQDVEVFIVTSFQYIHYISNGCLFNIIFYPMQNTRIQVYIKKEFMFKFEPLFEEGKCYIISNFGIAENGGKLPLLPHRFKISFYKTTIVTRIDPFDDNTHGFILEPFNHLLDPEHHQYYDNDAVGM